MTPDSQDRILDSLLNEAVGGQLPPDLSDRILQAWAAEQAAAEQAAAERAAPAERAAKNGKMCRNGQPADAQMGTPSAGRQSDVEPLVPPPVQSPPPGPLSAPPTSAVNGRVSLAHSGKPDARRRRRGPLRWPARWSAVTAMVVVLGMTTGFGLLQLTNPEAKRTETVDVQDRGMSGGQHTVHEPSVDGKRDGLAGENTDSGQPSAFDGEVPFGTGGLVADIELAEAEYFVERPVAEPLEDAQIVAAIDRHIEQLWEEHDVRPSNSASDAHWCRRAYLRLVGRIPTVDELDAFLQASGDRKKRLVEQLTESHEFAQHWATVLTNVLLGRTGGDDEADLGNRRQLHAFLQESLEKKKPYDQLVTELITARGSSDPQAEDHNPAVHYLVSLHDERATLATARTSEAFLGQQIRCVQCHDHQTNESWKQQHFWELNAFFRQIKLERRSGTARLLDVDFVGESGRNADEAEVFYEKLDGYQKAAYPAFFGQAIGKSGRVAEIDRRDKLARFIVTSPHYSRAVANRVWAHFFGYGFTRPIDDMGPHNSPSHPELLDLLADQFVAHDHDLRRLVRWIAASRPFELSSRADGNLALDAPGDGGPALFSRYYARPMEPEEVYNSLILVAQNPTHRSHVSFDDQQLWLGQFTHSMETDEGDEKVAFEGDVRQALEMMNGPLMKRAVSLEQDTTLRRIVQSNMTVEQKVDHLFLAAVARPPSRQERKVLGQIIQAQPQNPEAAYQDIWWALLNSNEFILDH